ncbi:hypothetical protein FOZ62_002962 [Perkinsus olseni]|uniref:Uncharacterized protein n=1 Tax=Perkinsus olseni TaxID=32597 RepID=A0A7J6R3C8_PEROL|nr:hypothetical protein FOZ62_002962 [Perkinsus olseni]
MGVTQRKIGHIREDYDPAAFVAIVPSVELACFTTGVGNKAKKEVAMPPSQRKNNIVLRLFKVRSLSLPLVIRESGEHRYDNNTNNDLGECQRNMQTIIMVKITPKFSRPGEVNKYRRAYASKNTSIDF